MANSSVLGYPRIGAEREWKRAIEAHWTGKLGEEELHRSLREIRLAHLRKLQAKGIDLIPVGDFSYYDHMLDTAAMFGIVPERFGYEGGSVPLSVYYAMARGTHSAAACEMTKWFNTNYHYIVPELGGTNPALTGNRPLRAYLEAKEELGIEGKPVIVGPLTFLKLSKGYEAAETDLWLDRLLPLYVQVLTELSGAGAKWVQIDEPILVTKLDEIDLTRLRRIFGTFSQAVPGLKLMLQTYFDSVEKYEEIARLPVAGIGLDLARGFGRAGNLAALREHGFPADKSLGAGIVNGRGIWRSDLEEGLALIEELKSIVPDDRLIVQTSCSLLHVPVSAARETKLPPELKQALAFADEKLDEVAYLARGGEGGEAARASSAAALEALRQSPARQRLDVRQAVEAMAAKEPKRGAPFAERRKLQAERFGLPLLPTTTIGSFPQSAEVRRARRLWRNGEWPQERYDAYIREQIDHWVALQEEIGLDVLVHGEFERTDMVEFFGEKLDGFAFTQFGWVQSYGSRCVKPPIIYGDVAYREAMTVKETVYAQSRTKRPVKGMLTGPVTILNWSFVRDDLSREQVAQQLAFALRQEVEALERAGIGMIQVDEPAVREGLPLKPAEHAGYLKRAVDAFRQTTCTTADRTQIHTHMCYCEFHDMIESIEAMDADVISIESSRSHGEMLSSFETHAYPLGIGLGVYDIHSPRVPSVEEMASQIERALTVLDPSLFWINPDCGLKTRGQEETVAALRNMAEAARRARERFAKS
ncbi:5-methyltetrahydropteroyltriglutamate--homocysteine S-methyltransferase [Cohnella lubricantis]|uniref:5-methyltetrahydropteroyltriglutamate--homocysteine methyltransferase n=1 Tax=Cohnella lubricantis TaxID=2163172 RepID=A0A841TG06_9BACL|nr:5-methyltetrahydropteroyltriglutamate--homocysteine S-methyltransferase [Cohnella lubricantis]MBB6677877.1 5-methyltetrahydropteroyltriglutamate--homocysteine S-methyltransferase [Cohnella lubricantis]MBP2119059.1 5-methyltetrahydropteroyltriglutamate--homocysteine methyltransferase [Cohnella lubricantis]